MREEIYKKIKSISDAVGTSGAAMKAQEISEDLVREYDDKISAGMDELRAYRAVLKDVKKIEEILRSMPKTDEEILKEERKENHKKANDVLASLSSILWIATVIGYVLISFSIGRWHLTWLVFLYSSILETIIGMVRKYNKGHSLKKVMRSGLSSVIWLSTIILYFLISFNLGYWHLTWLIFLAAALVQKIVGLIFRN